jgi:hypothetical protein
MGKYKIPPNLWLSKLANILIQPSEPTANVIFQVLSSYGDVFKKSIHDS